MPYICTVFTMSCTSLLSSFFLSFFFTISPLLPSPLLQSFSILLPDILKLTTRSSVSLFHLYTTSLQSLPHTDTTTTFPSLSHSSFMHLPLLSLPLFPKASSYTQRLSRLSLIRPLRTFPSSSHSSSTLSPSCSVSRKTCRVSIPRRTPPLQINVRYHESASQSMIHTRALSIYFFKKEVRGDICVYACYRLVSDGIR